MVSKIRRNNSSKTLSSKPFFNKSGEGSFFSQNKESEQQFFSPYPIQTKLTISQPNDQYEKQADIMAEEVVTKMENPNTFLPLNRNEKGTQEMKIIRKPDFENKNDSLIQTDSIESLLNDTKGKGRLIEKGIRANMESAFDTDLSSVKIHTDSHAIRMNRELGAKAFTHGSDIYFGQGNYDKRSKDGKKLLVHELTHTIQQNANNIKRIQRQRTEEQIIDDLQVHKPRNSRTGSSQQTLERFNARVPDLEVFTNLAISYGLQPNELLAIFMTEGGFAHPQYFPPEQASGGRRINSEAGLVGFHLWMQHGMDDFAITGARSGGDNTFNYNANNSSYQGRIRNKLAEFHSLGLLWDSNGTKPQDPRNQLSPNDILSQLTSQVNIGTQLPLNGFVMLAIRIQAAMFARRQGLIGRTRGQLEQLGTTPDLANRFRHRAFMLQRIRVANENGLMPGNLNPAQQVEWIQNHEHDADFGQALMMDDEYRNYIQESFNRRVSPAAARISMGTPAYFITRLNQANEDFRVWQSNRSQILRDQLNDWAGQIRVNAVVIGGPSTATSQDALLSIRQSITPYSISEQSIRNVLLGIVQQAERGQYANRIFDVVEYISDTYSRYNSISTTEQWLSGVLNERQSYSVIPRSLQNIMQPTARRLDMRHLRNFGIYQNWAQRVIDARREIESP